MNKKEKQLAEAFNEGIYINVDFRIGWGARKKLSKEYCESKGLDSDIERGTRDLLLPEDLEKKDLLTNKKMEVDAYMKDWSRSLPSGIKGLNFIKKNYVPETLEYLRATKNIVEQFAKDWGDASLQAQENYKTKYPAKYDASRYPTKEQIINGVVYHYNTVDVTPPSVEKVGEEEAKKAIENQRERINRAGDIIVEGFVTELYRNIKNINAYGSGEKAANSQVIETAKKLITLFRESLDTFIINEQIGKAIDDLDSLIEDDDPKELAKLIRDDEGLRNTVKDLTGNIMNNLQAIKDASIERALIY